jgi:hypothetical protein
LKTERPWVAPSRPDEREFDMGVVLTVLVVVLVVAAILYLLRRA